MVTTIGVILFYLLPALLLAEAARCVYLEHRRDRIPILLYHRLVARRGAGSGGADIEPIYVSYDDVFESQMRWLREKGFTTLDLDQFLAIRRDRAAPPPRAVILTFDDGYESVYRLAWPVLRRLGLKATVFVAPRPDDYTRRLVQGVDGFLSEDQMCEMDRGGVRIESHTLTHCVLSDLDDPSARHELAESKRLLGTIVGRPVRHLAVPRSGHSLRVRRLAREEGYVTV
ncbi:MAG TPA: polysaccharide deacetylase family protein, partial [Candidatus Polarisedimenticolia bacterium]|nr:polysaccharide deacetylase family protein [Candidatus Polarisedimenticolia bacterium]